MKLDFIDNHFVEAKEQVFKHLFTALLIVKAKNDHSFRINFEYTNLYANFSKFSRTSIHINLLEMTAVKYNLAIDIFCVNIFRY